ncbi:hypothetical protein JB92DRAFT_3128037 [Gautieria morchelliformis]|nr:hypothetical protein JB92DRAFT_3128037 [Gautieria morchelliformis]
MAPNSPQYSRRSTMRHRPIGIGVQGPADTFMALRMPFDSTAAKELNIQIFETIYHAAVWPAWTWLKRTALTSHGKAAQPAKAGFNLTCGTSPRRTFWEWDGLKGRVKRVGMRTHCFALQCPLHRQVKSWASMSASNPTQATSIHVLWDDDMKNQIIAANGESIQSIPTIPDDVKAIYKTVWELSQKKVVDLAADRAAYICQSQSLNVHLANPIMGQLTGMHFYGWKKALKAGMYLLRTRPAAQTIQSTIDQSFLKKKTPAVMPTPSPSPSPSPTSKAKAEPSTPKVNGTAISESPSPSPTPTTPSDAELVSLDPRTAKAASEDPDFAGALERQRIASSRRQS